MTKDEALKLALEALETKGEHHPRVYQAITAIKEALAQRTWVGLTDEDQFEFAKAQPSWEDLLIAAEAKLKQKNT